MKKVIITAQELSRLIILLATSSNLPKIVISRTYKKLNTPDLGAFAHDTVHFTGDPDATAPPVSDGTLQAKATSLLTDYGTWLKTKDPALEKQIKRKRNDLILQLDKDADYLQGVARDVAVAAGDVTAGEAVVIRIGFTLKKRTGGKKPDFGVIASGPNFVQLHSKKAKKGNEGHMWRYGITTAKGTPPPQPGLITHFTLETDVILHDLPSNTVIGIQHTSVLPVSHTKKTSAKTSKTATATPLSKAKHPLFSHTNPDPYNWTDFIYVVIQ
ncbi:MAG: hypothetical protein HY063_11035 [Bacteroidetes bacterium]|nr:hypothetical protein [Bacteroidota bacterium]